MGPIDSRDDEATLKQNDDDHCVRLPVPRETDVSHMKKNGCSIIVEAAGLNQSECHEILFQEGADVNLMDKRHTRYMCNEYVEVILEAGAHVNIRDYYGDTALMWAVSKGHDEYVETLIAAGADVNIHNHYGDTALMCAVCKDHGKYVETLIAAGADVNIHNYYGDTALMCAVCKGHGEYVDTLIAAGADVNIQRTKMERKLFLWHRIFDLQIHAGTDVNNTSRNGYTVMRRILRSPWMIVEQLKLVYSAGAYVNMINVDGVNVVRERKKITEILKLLFVCRIFQRSNYVVCTFKSFERLMTFCGGFPGGGGSLTYCVAKILSKTSYK